MNDFHTDLNAIYVRSKEIRFEWGKNDKQRRREREREWGLIILKF